MSTPTSLVPLLTRRDGGANLLTPLVAGSQLYSPIRYEYRGVTRIWVPGLWVFVCWVAGRGFRTPLDLRSGFVRASVRPEALL
jgi:hypothetical protein